MTNTEQGAERLNTNQDHQDRFQILKWINLLTWISPHDSTLDQHTFLSRKEPGTGGWLLESDEYKDWKTTKGQTLFCPGIPGAGKTILSVILIEDLENQFRHDPNVGVAYFYLNHHLEADQSVVQVLASLLRQLVAGRRDIPKEIQEMYDMRTEKVYKPKFDAIYKAIRSVAGLYEKVFVVIDALDECPEVDGRRSELLKAIAQLQVDISTNLLCTSRHIPDIEACFTKSTLVEVRATENDVRAYLDSHLDRLPGFVARSRHLQDEVKEAIVRAVDGRFLLAYFHLESLAYKRSPKALRAALTTLPSGSDACHQIYQDTIHHALMWIVYTKKPLTTLQLREALAVEENDPDIDIDNLPEIGDIITACGGLVAVNKGADMFQLSHHTVQEFFEQMQGTWIPDANSRITRVCLTYLSFLPFHEGPSESCSEFEKRLDNYSLYGYAARYWGLHAHRVPPSEVFAFFDQDHAFQASHQAFLVMDGRSSQLIDLDKRLQQPTTGLHVCACFGLLDAMHELNQPDTVDLQDAFGLTPLAVAARYGQLTSMQLLLEHGANANAVDGMGEGARSPLYWAAKSGKEGCVRLILEKLYPDSAYGRVLLTWVVSEGHTSIVKLLLDMPGVDLSPQDKHDCLYEAILNNDLESVRLLVSRVDIDLSFQYESPIGLHSHLELAIMFKRPEVFEILIESGKGDFTARGIGGWTLPHLCVVYNSTEVARVLLRTVDVDKDAKDDRGMTPLSLATRVGNVQIAKMLSAKSSHGS
ncbi:hypothetical protein FSARC_496 [Fusarium sarcochroum]|uniref:NACHT domain-containing protein n=1 Tax=Fusarium sarcochroum TaxID=1208366 RepID=A0A8H4UBR9_9HYPO|nr:hypothetical protein FSARC_496 [Fusarium sarcochroum]